MGAKRSRRRPKVMVRSSPNNPASSATQPVVIAENSEGDEGSTSNVVKPANEGSTSSVAKSENKEKLIAETLKLNETLIEEKETTETRRL